MRMRLHLFLLKLAQRFAPAVDLSQFHTLMQEAKRSGHTTVHDFNPLDRKQKERV